MSVTKAAKRLTSRVPEMELPLHKGDSPWDVFGDSSESAPPPRWNLVSLFSGCGGADLGFHFAGFKTLWANDINIDAAETFRGNLGPITVSDITKTPLPTFEKKIDVLAAGFPCQPFSNAGSRLGLEDTRGTLFYDALKAVEHFNPRVVLFENVRGLLSFNNGPHPLVQSICEALVDLNYHPVFKLVDASDHRVGQRRLRLIIVGVKNAKMAKRVFPAASDKTGLSIGQVLGGLHPKSHNQNERILLNPQAVALGTRVPEGGSWKNIADEHLPERLKKLRKDIKKYRWPNFYRRFHRDEVAGTVTAAFKPENAAVWHPVHGGVMSVREIARIQSFPDWFVFSGRTVKSKYAQIGNAVPPRLAYELGRRIGSLLSHKSVPPGPHMTFEHFLALGRPYRPSDPPVVYRGS